MPSLNRPPAIRIAALLIALVGLFPSSATTTQASAPPSNHTTASVVRTDLGQTGPTREVFGYATAGSLNDPTIGYRSWNFDLLSTVAFFSIRVRYDGKLIGDGSFAVWDSSVLTNLVATAHAHGTKVVVSITDPSNAIEECDALFNRATTVAQIVNQVKLKGVDGINIDYEGQRRTCTPTDPSLSPELNQTMITELAHDLRVALDAVRPGYYLSIATYTGSAAGTDGFFNIPDLAQYVDSFFIMGYDQDYGAWRNAGCTKYCMNPVSWLSKYVYNLSNSVAQYSQVAGADKVILGLPYYGRVACVPSPTVHAYPSRPEGAVTYTGARSVASDPDVKPGTFRTHRDPTDTVGISRWDTWYDLSLGCWREMYWDDPVSLAARYNLVNRAGIRGVGFWTLNYAGGSPEAWDVLSAYFKVWSAAYDLSAAPGSWVAGQPRTFNVSVTNSGTFTWPSGGSNPVELHLHFTTRPGGSTYQAYWLNGYTVPLPSDVPPGQSVTFPVTITAPTTSGAMYLEAEAFKSQQFWFTQTQPIQASVVPQTWIGSFDMSATPTEWKSGQTQPFSVTVTNTGNVPWPSGGANPVRLNLHFTPAAGGSAKIAGWLTSQSYALPNDVAPGGSVTVTGNVTAPASSGYLYLEAGLFKDHQFWFQQWSPLPVTVFGAWGVSYDLTQAPTNWSEGDSQTFQLTLTNRGTQAWPATGANPVRLNLHFTTAPGGSAKMASWLTSQNLALPGNVAPGASVTLSVTVKAPMRAGSMYLEAQLYKDKQFWFQQWAKAAVAVQPSFAATYDTCQLPATYSTGQTRSVTVTLTNTGADAWPSAGTNRVRFNLHFTTVPGGTAVMSKWVSSQSFDLPNDVAPGGSVSVTVNVTAPSSAAQLYLEVQAYKNQQFWFAQWLTSPATVGTPAYAADYNVCAAPRAWTKGQSQAFQVTLTNTGTQTWNASGANPFKLNVHFSTRRGGSAYVSSWVKSYNLALTSDVAPGQTVTVNVTVAAPTTAGSYVVEAQVFKDHQFWLQQWQGVAVTVS